MKKDDIKIKVIGDNIYLLVFPTKYYLNATMMRLQEYYESAFSEIRGKYFTHEQYMDAYADRFGNFTYFSDWSGTNTPGNVVYEWQRLFARSVDNVFSEKEKILLDILSDPLDYFHLHDDKFYVIATFDAEGNDNIINHELCHAMYYLNNSYRKKMNNHLKTFERRDELGDCLKKLSYADNVIDDEIQAYMATTDVEQMKLKIGFKPKKKELKPFQNVFEKTIKKVKL